MEHIFSAYVMFIIWGLLILCAVLLILCISSHVRISKLKRRTNRFMKQGVDKSVEELLYEHLEAVRAVDDKYGDLTRAVKDIDLRLNFCVSKIGLVRYNHFENVGGDLCFALALMDEKKNGVVINTIFSREGSYVYAKPLENGESRHALSDEEKKSILIALERNA